MAKIVDFALQAWDCYTDTARRKHIGSVERLPRDRDNPSYAAWCQAGCGRFGWYNTRQEAIDALFEHEKTCPAAIDKEREGKHDD